MAPEVILDFIFERGLLFVAVINIGDQPAHKVSVHFHQPLRGLDGTKDIATLAMFRNIEFLAPHKGIQTFLDSSKAYFERGDPVHIKADIAYVDSQGHAFGGPIEHDLEIYRDIIYINSPNSSQETVFGGNYGPNVTPGGNIGGPGLTPGSNVGPGSTLGNDVGPGSTLGNNVGPGSVLGSNVRPGSALGKDVGSGTTPLRPASPGIDPLNGKKSGDYSTEGR